MGYFANGSEGECFMEAYCLHCRNWRERDWRGEEGEGCPVWDLHLLLDQGAHLNEEPEALATAPQVTRFVLDFLIEREDGGGNRCSLFEPRGASHDPDTLSLFADTPEVSP